MGSTMSKTRQRPWPTTHPTFQLDCQRSGEGVALSKAGNTQQLASWAWWLPDENPLSSCSPASGFIPSSLIGSLFSMTFSYPLALLQSSSSPRGNFCRIFTWLVVCQLLTPHRREASPQGAQGKESTHAVWSTPRRSPWLTLPTSTNSTCQSWYLSPGSSAETLRCFRNSFPLFRAWEESRMPRILLSFFSGIPKRQF